MLSAAKTCHTRTLGFWDIVALLMEIHERTKSFRRDIISYWNNSAFGGVLQLNSFDELDA
jgi:hypothetical protein